MSLILTKFEYRDLFRRMPVISDAPVGSKGDLFVFGRYIDPLISILTDPDQETPFTIGIFGPWGSGKSTVLKILHERLADESYHDKFLPVDFNPWLYRSEGNILIPLLSSLRDALAEDPSERFLESAKKIGEILVRLGADLLLKTMTADLVSVEKLEKLESAYIAERARNDSVIRKLRKILQAELNSIKAAAKVVVFIDDLDRCDPTDIINVLESVKLFLDLENVFVIFALDREVIARGIEIRYRDFQFAEDRAAVIGNEYLEKMIQLPIELFPLSSKQVSGFLEKVVPRDAGPKLQETLNLLSSMASPNPRRIKRLLNSFAVIRALMEQQQLEELDAGILLRLVVLQVQYPELYLEIARRPEFLVALEESYQGVRNPVNKSDYAPYDDSETVQQFCKKHWRPSSLLSALFVASTFKDVEDKLPLYLTLLGEQHAAG